MKRFIFDGRIMATMKDLARIAGVSVGTVSNVINNKKTVKADIKKRVEDAIKLTDYKVNLHARGMILKKSFNVGLIVPSILDPFFPRLVDVIEQECEKLGMNVILSSSNYSSEREIQKIEQMLAKNVDGIILTPESDRNMSYMKNLINDGVPLVLLARRYTELKTAYVIADNKLAASDGLNYLYKKGYRNIAFLVSPLMNSADEGRLNGVQLWADKNKNQCDVSILYCAPLPANDRNHSMEHQMSQGYVKGLELIKHNQIPDAVFANNDYIAVGFMKACFEKSVRIPEDVALLGVSNQFAEELLIKKMSSFDPHADEMAVKAVSVLKEIMDKPEEASSENYQVKIAMSLLEGVTT